MMMSSAPMPHAYTLDTPPVLIDKTEYPGVLASGHPLHFIGIAGDGMSPLAMVLSKLGWQVSGSDLQDTTHPKVIALQHHGIKVHAGGHSASALPEGPVEIIISSALQAENPEIEEAQRRGCHIWHRAEVLSAMLAGELKERLPLACRWGVAGTHGKTTTTGMLDGILSAWQKEAPQTAWGVCTVVGGKLPQVESNYRFAPPSREALPWALVAELDESDGTLVAHRPSSVALTNLEPDHLDFYGDDPEEALETLFQIVYRFAQCMLDDPKDVFPDEDPCMVVNLGCPNTRTWLAYFGETLHEAGMSFVACYRREDEHLQADLIPWLNSTLAQNIIHVYYVAKEVRLPANTEKPFAQALQLDCFHRTKSQTSDKPEIRHTALGTLPLQVLGVHNQANALMAAALAHHACLPFTAISKGLYAFTGMGRRFETVGHYQGAWLIDDYAHHPTECKLTLAAARKRLQENGKGRLIGVFQPHRYTRFESLYKDFLSAFDEVDMLYVCDVFAAYELPRPHVHSSHFVKDLTQRWEKHTSKQAFYVETPPFDILQNHLRVSMSEDDIVISLGAGNVTQVLRQMGKP